MHQNEEIFKCAGNSGAKVKNNQKTHLNWNCAVKNYDDSAIKNSRWLWTFWKYISILKYVEKMIDSKNKALCSPLEKTGQYSTF